MEQQVTAVYGVLARRLQRALAHRAALRWAGGNARDEGVRVVNVVVGIFWFEANVEVVLPDHEGSYGPKYCNSKHLDRA